MSITVEKKKVKIEIRPWHYKCGEGCCDDFGESLYVNDIELTNDASLVGESIKMTLEHLGYEVDLVGYGYEFDGEDMLYE